jgi:glycosyltransferase involved in cell wall biosynthesis
MSIPIYILNSSNRIDKKVQIKYQMNQLKTTNYNFRNDYNIEHKEVFTHFENYKKKYPLEHCLTIHDIAFIQSMVELCSFIVQSKYYKPVLICSNDVCFHKEYYKLLKTVETKTKFEDLVHICNITNTEKNTYGYICNSHFRKQIVTHGLNWFLTNHITFEQGLQKLANENNIKTHVLDKEHLVHQYNDSNIPNYIEHSQTKRKFVFIVPSYNNEKWIHRNVCSMLSQKYEHWRMIYINDHSNDKTDELFHNLTKNHIDKIIYIKNNVRYGQAFNRYIAYNMCDDEEFCVMLDGDDWLYNDYVLEYLNNFMNIHDVNVTYGCFKEFYKNKNVNSSWNLCEYPNNVIKNKTYRQYQWCAVHLRVLKAEYLKQINPLDFIMDNNDFINCSTDMVESFASLELCNGKHKKVEECLMVYNKDNSIIHPESYYNKLYKDRKIVIQKKVRSITPYIKHQNKELVVINIENKNYKKEIQHYKDNYTKTHDLFLTLDSLKEYFTHRLQLYNVKYIIL